MSSFDVQAIDVHGHYGIFANSPNPQRCEFYSGDADEVVRRAQACNIQYTVVSPLLALMPRGNNDAVAGNIEAAEIVPRIEGLLQWVVIDPRKPETYEQADAMLKHPKCVGIKIHPEEHKYHINEYGRAIYEFAAERRALILTHSGEQNSLPCDFVPFADEFPEVRTILAHIGCGWDGDLSHQVRAVTSSREGNLHADTSSASSITPHLIEWAVQQIGADRVLFGTDTPLYFTAFQRARIDYADLSDDVKCKILRDNAAQLLGL